MTLPLEPFPHRVSKDIPVTPIEKRETAVFAFDKDSPVGDVTWEIERPATEQINQAIRNVLVRKPARFFDVTVQQVEKEDQEATRKTEEQHDSSLLKTEELPGTDTPTKAGQDVVEVAGKMMTVEEMGQMKVELHQTLGVAWNELNKIAELCRSLISTQFHPYVLPPNEATASVPAKSLSGTLADRAPPTQAVRLLGDTKLAVVRHIDSIKRSQDILVNGSKQLMALRAQEDVYWQNVLQVSGINGVHQDDLQDGSSEKAIANTDGSTSQPPLSWSLLPRPLSNGLPPNRQMATDVMIPYAPDEASPGFRALAMATMNQPDLTSTDKVGPQPEGDILFRARRHKRLRVCLRSSNGDESYSRITGLADPAIQGTISTELSRAQAEMFDDEIFETLRSEAKSTPTLNTRSSTDQISVDAVPGQELVFEMVDTDDIYHEQINRSVKVSTHVNLLSALLRLGMLRVYRTRSQTPAGSQPSGKELLTPIVAYLHYQAFCRQLYEVLNGFQQTMQQAGMSLEISRNTGGITGGLDWEAFLGGDASSSRQYNLKGNVEVLFEQRPFCTILVTADAHLTIIFSQTMFHSQDIAQLPVFLGQQLRSQVLATLVDNLKAHREPVRYHVDEIAGVIKTRPTKLDIGFTLDVPPHLVAQSSRILPVGEGNETKFTASDERIVKEQYTETTEIPFVAWAMERLL